MLETIDYLSQKIHRIDTSEIRKVFDLASQIKNPINLSIGQPDFPVPEPVKEAMIKAIQDNKNAYTVTQGLIELREALSEKWQLDSNVKIHPQNIIVSAGVASLLLILFDVLFEPNDEVVMIDPYFLIYDSLAQYHKLNVNYLHESFTKDDVADLAHSLKNKNLKAIILVSPSNPTGKIFDKSQVSSLVDLAREKNALIVADEIYEDYDYDNKFVRTASLYPEGTITLGGFSKSHAMTGWRVGYMGVPDNLKEIVQKVATLQQYSIVCSPQPAQWAAIEALKTDVSDLIALMKSRRDLVVRKLQGKVKFTFPDGAFYLFPEVNEDSKTFIEKAVKNRLLIVPGFIFSQKRNNIRISYAQKEEILEEGLDLFLKLL